jgi:arylsulfatase A-like enzyme
MKKCVLLLLVPLIAAAQPNAERMNVLFLIADDLNSWLLGDANRYTGKIVAPNLHKLAASGVNFTQAYTASPICSPSRTAFFSGVSPWKSGHYHNARDLTQSEPLAKAVSLARTFKNAGYSTSGYGKITHGWDQKDGWDEKSATNAIPPRRIIR